MLTEKLLAIDPIIIGIYLAVSLLLGIFGSRLLGMNNSKEEDYYLAGRKMPGWLSKARGSRRASCGSAHFLRCAPRFCRIF